MKSACNFRSFMVTLLSLHLILCSLHVVVPTKLHLVSNNVISSFRPPLGVLAFALVGGYPFCSSGVFSSCYFPPFFVAFRVYISHTPIPLVKTVQGLLLLFTQVLSTPFILLSSSNFGSLLTLLFFTEQ